MLDLAIEKEGSEILSHSFSPYKLSVYEPNTLEVLLFQQKLTSVEAR